MNIIILGDGKKSKSFFSWTPEKTKKSKNNGHDRKQLEPFLTVGINLFF